MKILALLLFLVSCSSTAPSEPVEKKESIQKEMPNPSDRLSGVSVTLELSKFNKSQSDKLQSIKDKVFLIINSKEFKEKVINFYTNGSRKFNETKMSNEQVYQALLSKDWDVKIELAKGGRNVLGWTNPNTPWIWFNSRYFEGREESGLAGTFCHEMSHKLGFGHAFRDYKGREFTVPYGVGTICSQLYR